jgi:hypothetical protein
MAARPDQRLGFASPCSGWPAQSSSKLPFAGRQDALPVRAQRAGTVAPLLAFALNTAGRLWSCPRVTYRTGALSVPGARLFEPSAALGIVQTNAHLSASVRVFVTFMVITPISPAR